MNVNEVQQEAISCPVSQMEGGVEEGKGVRMEKSSTRYGCDAWSIAAKGCCCTGAKEKEGWGWEVGSREVKGREAQRR